MTGWKSLTTRSRPARPVPPSALLAAIPGLSAPTNFGPAVPNVAGPEQPLLDEITLALDIGVEIRFAHSGRADDQMLTFFDPPAQ